MRTLKILTVIIAILVTSCGKDDKADSVPSIEGHWHIFDFQPDDDSPVNASSLAKAAIAKLVAEECDPIEFTFWPDKRVLYKDGTPYLDVSFDNGGVDVLCGERFDFKEGTFDFDTNTLTLNYQEETLVVEATLDDEFLTTQVDDLLINEELVSGKLIFKREISE